MTTLVSILTAAMVTLSVTLSPLLHLAQPDVKKRATQQPSTLPTTAPGVFVKDEQGNSIALSISKLDVDVQITGTIATTTLDMTVYNPHNKILEGEFSFPVTDGQTVSRFALDINGKLREAVVVDKSKGRSTFEEVIRTKVDPALLEWTRDNSFRARIYPIPERGKRRIVIAYEQQLTSVTNGLGYTIPFAYPTKIDAFTFHAVVAGSENVPSLSGSSNEVVDFTPQGRTFVVEMEESDILVNKPFTINVPVAANQPRVVVQSLADVNYAAIFLNTESAIENLAHPRSITVFWDASLSGLKRDTAKELEYLQELLRHTGASKVSIVAFANEVVSRKTFTASNLAAIVSYIRSIPMDGGTQLGSIPFNEVSEGVAIVFSDGISTLGKHTPASSKVPVIVVVSSPQADHDVLHTICNQSGGSYISLKDMDVATAVNNTLASSRTIEEVEVVEGTFDNIRHNGAAAIARNTAITGILHSASAVLRITTAVGGKNPQYQLVSVHSAEHAIQGASIPRLWATQELQRLSSDRVRNADSITALGQHFTIVTPGTSLIVLERFEDYLRFAIQPPASEPELLQQYQAEIENQELVLKNQRQMHRAMVLSLLAQTQLPNTVQNDSKFWIWPSTLTQPANVSIAELGKIAGTIVNSQNEPLPNAVVYVAGTPLSTMTRTDGTFTFANVPTGSVLIGAQAEGLGEATIVKVVNAGSVTPASFKLAAPPKNAQDALRKLSRQGKPSKQQPVTVHFVERNGAGSGHVASEMVAAENVAAAPLSIVAPDDATSSLARGRQGVEVSSMVLGGSLSKNSQQIMDGLVAGTADIIADNDLANFFADNNGLPTTTQIRRDAWTDTLSKATSENLYQRYLDLRPTYANITGFYLDVADALIAKHKPTLALRVLSSLAELQGEDARTLRILAHRLRQLGHHDLAVSVFEDVLRIRDEEPQSYRDLALAQVSCGRVNEAVKNLVYILEHPWANRFPEIELIAARELSSIVSLHTQLKKTIDTNYLISFASDLRVVLTWDADNCDMDLWVTDPSGEVCKYNHRNTKAGGTMSRDLTGGYGPEEFILPHAKKGGYKIQVHYYGDRQQTLDRPTTIQVDTFTKYGRTDEQHNAVTMRLDGVSRVIDIGTVLVN